MFYKMKIANTEIELVKGDITMLDVDAIVNPANSGLIHAGGLALAIVKRGGHIIQQESKKIGFVPTGSAVFTRGGSLKAEWVIHAVGPKYKDGKSGEAEKLESAVKASLHIAEGKKVKSLAIPAISSGIYGYPVEESSKIIVDTVIKYFHEKKKEKTESTIEKVILCLFDDQTFNNFEKAMEKHSKTGKK